MSCRQDALSCQCRTVYQCYLCVSVCVCVLEGSPPVTLAPRQLAAGSGKRSSIRISSSAAKWETVARAPAFSFLPFAFFLFGVRGVEIKEIEKKEKRQQQRQRRRRRRRGADWEENRHIFQTACCAKETVWPKERERKSERNAFVFSCTIFSDFFLPFYVEFFFLVQFFCFFFFRTPACAFPVKLSLSFRLTFSPPPVLWPALAPSLSGTLAHFYFHFPSYGVFFFLFWPQVTRQRQ